MFLGNLPAMVDWGLHPEIPYFDEEHLVVGGITAITMILLLGTLEKDLARRKQMDAILLESNEQFRVIFEGSKDGILLADVESRGFVTC